VVDAERRHPLERLDATVEAIHRLREISASEEPLGDVLGRVAATAAHAIPDADAATVTVLTGGKPQTLAWTDKRLVRIEEQQYAADRGPGLDAARSHRPVRAVVGDRREEWPEFASAAERAGIHAYLSAPLLVDGPDGTEELVGSLNVYSLSAEAFDPFDEGLLRLYTAVAAWAIHNSRLWQQSREKIVQLETALTSRADIDQAMGIVMALHGCTADEAFARLAEQSQRSNTPVRTLARDLLLRVRAAGGPASAAT
jgi:transcriptional regulator with GAF, ATPase, and Fis domain